MTSRPVESFRVAARPGHPPSWAPVGIGRSEGTVVLTLAGVLDASGIDWLEHLLGDLVEGQGNQFVAVDLGSVEGVDASVLALLVAFSGRAARRGGRLILREPSAAVLEVLQAGLDGALEMVPPSSESPIPLGDSAGQRVALAGSNAIRTRGRSAWPTAEQTATVDVLDVFGQPSLRDMAGESLAGGALPEGS